MNKADRELLLRDLCSRLPYGVIMDNRSKVTKIDAYLGIISGPGTSRKVENVRPYLRAMTSMTPAETKEFHSSTKYIAHSDGSVVCDDNGYQWLEKHHFDHRGLIPKGLAIAVTEDDNPYKSW